MKREADKPWFDRHFPNARARREADKVVDQLEVSDPMSMYIDQWIAAYKRAGGKTKL
jgi:hypothetical protein